MYRVLEPGQGESDGLGRLTTISIFKMRCMNKYKVKFKQAVSGFEFCEAVIDAENQVEALAKFDNRDFTVYVRTKEDVERTANADEVESIEQIS